MTDENKKEELIAGISKEALENVDLTQLDDLFRSELLMMLAAHVELGDVKSEDFTAIRGALMKNYKNFDQDYKGAVADTKVRLKHNEHFFENIDLDFARAIKVIDFIQRNGLKPTTQKTATGFVKNAQIDIDFVEKVEKAIEKNGGNTSAAITEVEDDSYPVSFVSGGKKVSWKFKVNQSDLRWDQQGFIKLLYLMMKDNVIYDIDNQAYWIWNGVIWTPFKADSGELRQFIVQLVELLPKIAIEKVNLQYDWSEARFININGEKPFLPGTKFMNMIQRKTNINDAFTTLQSSIYLGRSNIKWDNHLELLNFNNGVLNLKTGEFDKNPSKDLYMTKRMAVNYNPQAAKPELFTKFLHTTFGCLMDNYPNSRNIYEYVQLLFGYFLIGGNRSEKMIMLHGSRGQNGKSVMVNVITRLMGINLEDKTGYATNLAVEHFLEGKYSKDATAPNPSFAKLPGRRLVTTEEPKPNTALAEGRVKSIAGNDPLTTRNLFKGDITFTPQFKLAIACNHLPKSSGGDPIARRLIILPFKHYTDDDHKDPDLENKLWSEREGIMNWLVEGAHHYYDLIKERQANGGKLDPLTPLPTACQHEVNGYLSSANSVAEFLKESITNRLDYFNYLYTMVFPKITYKFKTDRKKIFDGNAFNKDYIDYHRLKELELPVFPEQKLLAYPGLYTKKENLYKMYLNYCDSAGYRLRKAKPDFYNDLESKLKTANIRSVGRVFMGVAPTPMPGEKQSYDDGGFSKKKYVESIDGLKDAIIMAASGQFGTGSKLYNTYDQFSQCLNDKLLSLASTRARNNVTKYIKSNPDVLYAGVLKYPLKKENLRVRVNKDNEKIVGLADISHETDDEDTRILSLKESGTLDDDGKAIDPSIKDLIDIDDDDDDNKKLTKPQSQQPQHPASQTNNVQQAAEAVSSAVKVTSNDGTHWYPFGHKPTAEDYKQMEKLFDE